MSVQTEGLDLFSKPLSDSVLRRDRHRPGVLVPSEYRAVGFLARPGADDMPFPVEGLDRWHEYHRAGRLAQRHGGPFCCDLCGARYNSGAFFEHMPSGDVITVGWMCAERLEMGCADERVGALAYIEGERRRARRRRERWVAGRAIGRELLSALRVDHPICRDIRGQVMRDPGRYLEGLSERQAELVRRLRDEAAAPSERWVPVPVDGERIRVEGEVVGVRWVDHGYGETCKITVRVGEPTGAWLAYGTAPAVLIDGAQDGGLRGMRVGFVARVVRGGRDEHFGFFSRPTRAGLLT